MSLFSFLLILIYFVILLNGNCNYIWNDEDGTTILINTCIKSLKMNQAYKFVCDDLKLKRETYAGTSCFGKPKLISDISSDSKYYCDKTQSGCAIVVVNTDCGTSAAIKNQVLIVDECVNYMDGIFQKSVITTCTSSMISRTEFTGKGCTGKATKNEVYISNGADGNGCSNEIKKCGSSSDVFGLLLGKNAILIIIVSIGGFVILCCALCCCCICILRK
mmetsp:Transcript_108305/g.132132  ORF Transcript_108305/g.132132 Transcript_108305/m.132132 type:complete len:219 (+) Transcript_108305:27-683(+)